MFYLNEIQIDIIKKEVLRHDIYIAHLPDDMVDHICCDVEEEIWNGATFDDAYKKIMERIGDKGLQEIQKETLYLIDKNYRIMKKSMKIIGIISMSMVAFGSLFKIQHWPGASVLLAVGFLLLATVFFPSAIATSWKESKLKGRLFLNIAGTIGGILLMFGILFKIQHWPGASILLVLGYNILAILLIPAFVINKLRDKDDQSSKAVYVVGAIAMIFALEGCLFKIQHYPGASILLIVGTLLLSAVFLPMLYAKLYKKSDHVSSSFIILCVGITMFNILSLLMAMNVSKSVISDFIRPGDELAMSGRMLHLKNQSIFNELISDTILVDKTEKEELIRINQKSEELHNYIKSIKIKLAQMSLYNDFTDKSADFISPKNFIAKDNSDFAPSLMISGGMGHELKIKFDDYRTILLSSISKNNLSVEIINKALDTSDPGIEGETWETYCFQNSIIVSSFSRLSFLQQNVEIATSEAFDYFRNKIKLKRNTDSKQIASIETK